ncbi:unnamed protein product, partial [Bubo scandiacus]
RGRGPGGCAPPLLSLLTHPGEGKGRRARAGGRRPRSVRTPEALVTPVAALAWVGTRGRRPAVTNPERQRGGACPSPAAPAAAGAGGTSAAPWRGVSGNKLLPALPPFSPPFLPPARLPLLARLVPGGARSASPLPAAGAGARPPPTAAPRAGPAGPAAQLPRSG